MCEPGEPATIRRLSAPSSLGRKPSLRSPLISSAFSPEVTWQASVQSPPGLECATPAKLWPATPLLDAYKLSSPMVLGPRDVRKDLPEVLLLSPPCLFSEPKAGLEPLAEGLPLPIPETEQQKMLESSKTSSAISAPAKKNKKGSKITGDKASKKKEPTSAQDQQKVAGDKVPKRKNPATGQLSELKEEVAEVPESSSKAQTLTTEQANCSHCCICEAEVQPLAEQSDKDPNHVLIDGHRVCDDCYGIFESSSFAPKYQICCNFLCRRKWKQLTPKSLTLFCPPCKRLLEGGIVEEEAPLEIESLVLMYGKWYDVAKEIADALKFPFSALTLPDVSVGSDQPARWRHLLKAFQDSCPPTPSAESVRNWNSVHGRKLYFRGKVRRGIRRFVCTVEASMELQDDLTTTKKIPGGPKHYLIIDWEECLKDEQEVLFLAFPNPSVNERDRVSKLARLLAAPTSIVGPDTVAVESGLALPIGLELTQIPSQVSKAAKENAPPEAHLSKALRSEPQNNSDVAAHKMQDDAKSSPEEDVKFVSKTAPGSLQVPSANTDSSPDNSPPGSAFQSLSDAFASAGGFGSFNDLMQWTDEIEDNDMVVATTSHVSPERSKGSPELSQPRPPLPGKPPGVLHAPSTSPDTNPASSRSPAVRSSISLPTPSPQTLPATSPKGGNVIKMGKAKPAPTAYRQSPLIAPKSPFASYFGD